MKQTFKTLIGVMAAAAVMTVQAQAWPSKPVRIIVPFAPGGTVDVVARTLAQALTEQTGQPFVVENRAGASGLIGSDIVAKAPADGYTLLVQAPTLIASPLMLKSVPYDVIRDFRPISLLGSVPMVMAANPSVPAANLKEFVALAKANPKQYAFGTSAIGSPMHVAQASIKSNAKLDIPIIVYKGTAGAINDVLGGQISAIIDAMPSTYPHIASGKLKALAVTTKTRMPQMPNVPTVAESGFPEFEMVSWYGLWAPAKLPDDIAKKLNAEASKAMRSPKVTERLRSQSFISASGTPDDFARHITKEIATYSRVVRDANIQIE
ncbi:MAG: tripartite tricarboxylate transporter substrate binding protein [Pseudomonadota bacterium]